MKVYILMGVSGVGKTTIGKILAEKLQLPFYDADDFHAPDNIQKMERGIPLQDIDRKDWLYLMAEKIQKWHKEGGAVVACSALKENYRRELTRIPEEFLTWIFLHSDFDVVHQRLSSRTNHFFDSTLLRSQYDSLEVPDYGVHVDAGKSEKEIIEEIMKKVRPQQKKSEIGIVGMGVMGKSLALNFASHGFQVSVYNRNVPDKEEDIANQFVKEHQEDFSFSGFDELQPFVESLETPAKILLMIPAGKPVDLVIHDLKQCLKQGDLIMDGGNSHYKDTLRRYKELKENEIHFFGIGISGGEEGALKGPSIMPGGDKSLYSEVGKLLEVIAAKDTEGNPCCTYVGPAESAHFVKMVHNGIEYGEMQLIAEVYHFARFFYGFTPEDIALEFENWNKELRSYLLEITVQILRRKGEDDGFLIDEILDAAKQKGTGGWSTNAALELGVPLDTITAAVMARNISGRKEERIKAEEIYGFSREQQPKGNLLIHYKAFCAARIINHAIGFDLLKQASQHYDWNLDLSEISRIWTNGCIIRSAFMERLSEIFKSGDKKHLLLYSEVASDLTGSSKNLIESVSTALQGGIPVPVHSAAACYFLNFTRAQSSANIIQAQRDFFGAHTYERTDKPRGQFFHTDWEKL